MGAGGGGGGLPVGVSARCRTWSSVEGSGRPHTRPMTSAARGTYTHNAAASASILMPASKCPLTQVGMVIKSNQLAYIIRMTIRIASQ